MSRIRSPVLVTEIGYTRVWTRQPRSQGTISSSLDNPGCGWSRVDVYKSNPHRGWVFDLIVSTLSMEVKVVLPYRRYFES